MSIIKSNTRGVPSTPLLAEFRPLKVLWAPPNPPYPSEYSARWEIRKLRHALADANAVALHRGRLLVHPQRFAQVAEQAAVAAFSDRQRKA